MARRTLGVASALAAAGHAVSLLVPTAPPGDSTLHRGIRVHNYPELGVVGHFFNPLFSRALRLLLAAGTDLLITEFPYHSPALIHSCRHFKVPLIYNSHNCEADRSRQLRSRLVSALVARREAYLAREAKAVLAVSSADQALFRELYGRTVLLLPNGVDGGRFTPGPADSELAAKLGLRGKRVALFFGSMDYKPNRLAVERLLRLNWPLQVPGQADTELLLVGRGSVQLTPPRSGVIAAGEVGDIVPYIRLANLVLAPVEEGGGTRLKIIEALACAQIVLSTGFGAQGLATDGIEGLHCCAWPDFEGVLYRLLSASLPPGNNAGGAAWARTMDWNRLVADIPWEDFTASR
ncbi:MAG: glycosyltransferase [Halioglobus sp.]|nr:glycosyltransferase [Halioglobus sp.]